MPKRPNILINIQFCLILSKNLANDIALNHYNDLHPLEKTSEGVSKTMSTKTILSSGFIKLLAIADINGTSHLLSLKKVKQHWGSISVPEMLQVKLHRVVVSNVDVEVLVGWLKFWNGIRFDRDAIHVPKSSLSDFTLDN